jgi:site-specific DNA-methyltransferase (adenine-specific)
MLLKGNCLELLKSLPDASVDSVVTDPPYELGFMGKAWDNSGIAYNVELWKECLRVLKPGGHLLAFSGSRTYHRIAVAIEDAGFEIRDSIHWTYGSGFPKSLNVSKAIDKAAGAEREVVGYSKGVAVEDNQGHGGIARGGVGIVQKSADIPITAPATVEAQQWQGWGTALKPSHEPIVIARKPLEGTVANNVLTHGTGALNIDGSRVAHQSEADRASATPQGKVTSNLSAGSAPDVNDEGRKDVERPDTSLGRWPANTIITHSSACRQMGTNSEIVGGGAKASSGFVTGYDGDGFVGAEIQNPVWECAEDCPTQMFPDSNGGAFPQKSNIPTGKHYEGGWKPVDNGVRTEMGSGSAARFFTQTTYDDHDFPPLIYQAKAGKAERNAGLEGLPEQRESDRVKDDGVGGDNPRNRSNNAKQNFHPTIKPLALMRYLIRLVTPPQGVVLDPFLGSGTTAVAAVLEGCEWIGCELTEDYWPIIEARVSWAENQKQEIPTQPDDNQQALF